jgi:Flp pilus assembly protein TadG
MRRCSSYKQAKVVQRADQQGQILVLFTLAVVAMIAMVGLVIDGGSAFAQRRGQQNVADLAALAGADALLNGQTQAQATSVAKNVATSNFYTDGTGGVVINVTFPAGKVQVDVSAPHRNYFAGIVGQPTWPVSTTATALSGVPDTALGAAPVIMSISDFGSDGQPLAAFSQAACSGTNADGSTGCIWGNGNGDVPNNATDWAWTLYGDNVNTSTVRAYLEGVGKLNGVAGCNGTPPPAATIADGTAPYWGQGNNGMHNGAFNSANCLIGLDVPVPIVGPPTAPATTCTGSTQTDGCFKGWAMFHVTDWTKHGNQSHWMGWFLPSGVQYPSLTVTGCSGSACPELGTPQLKLVN